MRLLSCLSREAFGPENISTYLQRDGLVLISEATADSLRRFVFGLGDPVDHPHDRDPGVTVIRPLSGSSAEDGTLGFSRQPLALHTDRSLAERPPSLLASIVTQPADDGGDSLFLDGARLLSQLIGKFGRRRIRSLRLRARSGLSYPIFEEDGQLFRMRFRSDALARPGGDQESGVIIDHLDNLLAHPTRVILGAGDGYILHNYRLLHGRLGFTGNRSVMRFLAWARQGSELAWMNQGFRIVAD